MNRLVTVPFAALIGVSAACGGAPGTPDDVAVLAAQWEEANAALLAPTSLGPPPARPAAAVEAIETSMPAMWSLQARSTSFWPGAAGTRWAGDAVPVPTVVVTESPEGVEDELLGPGPFAAAEFDSVVDALRGELASEPEDTVADLRGERDRLERGVERLERFLTRSGDPSLLEPPVPTVAKATTAIESTIDAIRAARTTALESATEEILAELRPRVESARRRADLSLRLDGAATRAGSAADLEAVELPPVGADDVTIAALETAVDAAFLEGVTARVSASMDGAGAECLARELERLRGLEPTAKVDLEEVVTDVRIRAWYRVEWASVVQLRAGGRLAAGQPDPLGIARGSHRRAAESVEAMLESMTFERTTPRVQSAEHRRWERGVESLEDLLAGMRRAADGDARLDAERTTGDGDVARLRDSRQAARRRRTALLAGR